MNKHLHFTQDWITHHLSRIYGVDRRKAKRVAKHITKCKISYTDLAGWGSHRYDANGGFYYHSSENCGLELSRVANALANHSTREVCRAIRGHFTGL